MIDYYIYIYKYFKLAIFSSLFMLINIVMYVDGYLVHANNVYISDDYLIEQQMKYTHALYWLDINLNISEDITNEEEVTDNNDSINTIGFDFNLYINELWIQEELFTFPLTLDKEKYTYINSKKLDQNMIDFELIDITNLDKGFIIWAHSSWLWTDESKLKKVFNWLEELEIWAEVELKRNDGKIIKYKVKNKEIKELDDTIKISNRYYLYTCYPVGSTDQRLIVELERLK